MDVALLAQSITGVLATALPFLIIGGKKAAEAAGNKIGSDTWEKGKEIWGKLRPEMDEDAEKAAREVAHSPRDLNAQQALRQNIEKILRCKPDLAKQIGPIISVKQKVGELEGVVIGLEIGKVIGDISGLRVETDQEINHVSPTGKAVGVSIKEITK